MAMVNISVAATSPLIHYRPPNSWTEIDDDSGLDASGSHMLTTNSDAFATITFNFTSFYFLAPQWPYKVASQIIMGDENITVDLQDHTVPDLGTESTSGPTIKSSVRLRGDNGRYMEQSVRISIPPGGNIAVVDMFLFEVPASQSSTTSGSIVTPTVTVTFRSSGVYLPGSSPTSTLNSKQGASATTTSHSHITNSSNSIKGPIIWAICTVGIAVLLCTPLAIFVRKRSSTKRKAVARRTFDTEYEYIVATESVDQYTIPTNSLDENEQVLNSERGSPVHSFVYPPARPSPNTAFTVPLSTSDLLDTNVESQSTSFASGAVSPISSLLKRSEYNVVNEDENAFQEQNPTEKLPRYSLVVGRMGGAIDARGDFERQGDKFW